MGSERAAPHENAKFLAQSSTHVHPPPRLLLSLSHTHAHAHAHANTHAASLVAVDLARKVLSVTPGAYVLVVSHENITNNWCAARPSLLVFFWELGPAWTDGRQAAACFSKHPEF